MIVDVTVQNSGEVAASVDSVYLNFLRNINSFTHNASFPISLAGGASQAIQFTVTIDNSAATGVDSIRAVASGENSFTAAPLNETSAYLDAWDVIGTEGLVVVSVSPDRDSVSTGQQDVPVTVKIRNGAATDARIDSISLSISRGSYDSLYILPAAVLASGQTAQYIINVDVLSSSVSGVATLDAGVYGWDL
ncbi:MAG: hypothetical protein GY727_11380, partial [Gammaproteobacteria bacterium]|nr:hypothetical protein [Gammaproteobacteria bacterium]